MENKKQITQDELEIIKKQQNDLSAVLTNIGVLEAQKHAFLHQLAELNKEVEDFKGKLQEAYGAINVNLQDGSYTLVDEDPIETVEAEEVN
jgi:hypothetical protein